LKKVNDGDFYILCYIALTVSIEAYLCSFIAYAYFTVEYV